MLKICLYHGDLHSNPWKSVLHFRPAVLYVTIVFVPRVSLPTRGLIIPRWRAFVGHNFLIFLSTVFKMCFR